MTDDMTKQKRKEWKEGRSRRSGLSGFRPPACFYDKWFVEEAENERDRLALDNLWLVFETLRDINFPKEVVEDLFNEGVLALVLAADSYDPDNGVKFTTYASTCIRHSFLDLLRKSKRTKAAEISLETEVHMDGDEEGGKFSLGDMLHEGEDPVWAVVCDGVETALSEEFAEDLTPEEREILLLYISFGEKEDGLSIPQIARMKGCTKSQIVFLKRQIRRKYMRFSAKMMK